MFFFFHLTKPRNGDMQQKNTKGSQVMGRVSGYGALGEVWADPSGENVSVT